MSNKPYEVEVLKFKALPAGWWNYYFELGNPENSWRTPCPGVLQIKVKRNGIDQKGKPFVFAVIVDHELTSAEHDALNNDGAYYQGTFFGDSAEEYQEVPVKAAEL